MNQSELKQIDVSGAKRGKTRATKAQLFFFLIGWEGGAKFLNQSQREVKQGQNKHELLSTQMKILL